MTEFLKSVNKWFIVSHDLFELTPFEFSKIFGSRKLQWAIIHSFITHNIEK